MSTRLADQVLVSIAARVLYLATRLVLPPVILSQVSLAEYGLWASAFILVAYIGMSAFGIGNVYIRYIAEWHCHGNTDAINRLLSTGLLLSSLIGIVAFIGVLALLPQLLTWLAVPETLQHAASWVFLGVVGVFLFDLSLGSLLHVLGALQQFKEEALIWIAAFLLESALIIVLLFAGYGLQGLVIAFAIRYACSTALAWWRLHHHLPGLRLSPRLIDRSLLPLFWHFGGIVQLSGMLGMVLGSIEKVLAGFLLGPAATALFELGQKFPVMLVSIPSAINAAAFPATTQLLATEGMAAARALYLANLRYVGCLCSFICAFLSAFALPALTAWLGARSEMPVLCWLLSLFCLPYQLMAMTGPASSYFRAISQPARELVYPLSQIALLVALLPLMFYWQGITVHSIAMAVAASMCLSALIYLAYAHAQLGISLQLSLQHIALPVALPYVLAAVLASTLPPMSDNTRLQALLSLFEGGVLYGAGLSGLAVLLATKEEKSWLSNGWLRLRASR